MSAAAAILALLALTLIGGAVWYERSRPPTQVIALVAALAALAATGRVLLAPVPNVVPTTDLTLISGYALGGPPGFAVGALAALASNFWLGQGPWTPWQMAGWGLAGLLGAALARLSGRSLGRVGLAVACGLAGLAYGALLDLSVMVSYGGEQSLDRYLVLAARGLPFNLAHAAGNVAFALIAGPALVRMLSRYRQRFEFAWAGQATRDPRASGGPRASGAPRATRDPRASGAPGAGGGSRAGGRGAAAAGSASLLAVALLGAGIIWPGAVAAGQEASASAGEGARAAGQVATASAGDRAGAVAYLRSAQNGDGGFGFSPEAPSSAAITGWAALGLEAAGLDPASVRSRRRSALDYVRSTVDELTEPADLERTILVVVAAGLDPRRFDRRDLVGRLLRIRRGDGSWGGQVNPTAFGVLALEAAGSGAAGRSAAWLVRNRNPDGGWGFAPGAGSDADSTGAVLQALAAAGSSREAISGGVSYLRRAQLGGGGFPLRGGGANAQSTAWAVQGLLAAGVSPSRVRRGGRGPLGYLASLQAADGHYRYSRRSDQTPVWVTAQALMAAAGRAFPLPPLAAAAAGGSAGAASGSTGSAGSSSGTAGGPSSAVGAAGAIADAAGAAPGEPAPGEPATGEAAAGEAEAAPGAPEQAASSPARFESEDGGSDAPLLAAIAAGIVLIAALALALRRQARAP